MRRGWFHRYWKLVMWHLPRIVHTLVPSQPDQTTNSWTGSSSSLSLAQRMPFKNGLNKEVLVLLLGEGNGTPLQYSGLENPMDGGAW